MRIFTVMIALVSWENDPVYIFHSSCKYHVKEQRGLRWLGIGPRASLQVGGAIRLASKQASEIPLFSGWELWAFEALPSTKGLTSRPDLELLSKRNSLVPASLHMLDFARSTAPLKSPRGVAGSCTPKFCSPCPLVFATSSHTFRVTMFVWYFVL